MPGIINSFWLWCKSNLCARMINCYEDTYQQYSIEFIAIVNKQTIIEWKKNDKKNHLFDVSANMLLCSHDLVMNKTCENINKRDEQITHEIKMWIVHKSNNFIKCRTTNQKKQPSCVENVTFIDTFRIVVCVFL